MLGQIVKYQNAKLIFLTEKEDTHSIALIPASLNMAEDILIIDMDSNCQNIKRELLKYNIPNLIGVSEKWDIEKVLCALSFGCRACLENGNLASLGNTIELVQKSKASVFDASVSSIIRILI